MNFSCTSQIKAGLLFIVGCLLVGCSKSDPAPATQADNLLIGNYKGRMELSVYTATSGYTQVWDPMTVSIKAGSKTGEVSVLIGTKNGDFNYPWTATVSSTSITIPSQQAKGDPYAFAGKGTLIAKALSMTFTETEVGTTKTPYQYTLTATQQ